MLRIKDRIVEGRWDFVATEGKEKTGMKTTEHHATVRNNTLRQNIGGP